ncbi:uncharacterized protein HMPREF1541_01734 [Cyphellophora europaea CBS 101466]|uniref:ATP-dependent RNA helicase n=1 Tax=Cyphellophora europaea (strain CBS 101466) TaxID=1220924 RepID=W2S1M0_CYPE1|nr:uncharacterized protein HMPREF1541_01734 [Cyphellophora europaea CBS 101466]ETN42577.1 hypothetical protein HMPREF1541_01734 [Cyphellophora europaea CBS 101466]
MSQFYARYIPTASKPITSRHDSPKLEKRKRTQDEHSTKSKKRLKNDRADESQAAGVTAGSAKLKIPKEANFKAAENKAALVEDSSLGLNTSEDELKAANEELHEAVETEVTGSRPKTKAKKRKNEHQHPDEADEEYNKKHGGVLSKFNRALAERPAVPDPEDEETAKQANELHGLEPIPQPEVVDVPVQKPTYSVLPSWQSNAVRVVHRQTKKFSDFTIAASTVENLRKHGLEKSFPIQTTVLPLLLEGSEKHEGDVCVSAATGSGKTLAYVLPMIEDLKEYSDTKLRGVIVVPTRELVQQVRKTCESCAAGTKLKIATASGNKTLKGEQNLVVAEEEVYDPERWEREQRAPVDWSSFSVADFIQEARERRQPSSIHFVKQLGSKVDILITTPGRLVDHLRSTPGFNLDHVKWLAVDEADRLLNESYQEWIDVVVPALRSQAATAERDRLLRHMRMQAPPRDVRKVLLSATMTRDISKLNSMGLVNPKLVVLGHPPSQPKEVVCSDNDANGPPVAADGAFHLPSSLTEFVIPIKDGYEKPMYLLELLQSRILHSLPKTVNASDSKPEDGSESSTSASETDSSTDSDTDTDTDSDSDSDDSVSSSSSAERRDKKSSPAIEASSRTSATRVLIFTRSTAATLRLSRLLSLLYPEIAPLISTLTKSTASSSSSRHALSSFRSGRTPVLIATDRASRGLDISELSHVVSYDVPSSALTYVHRVGRTARAGKEGTAWTIVEHREGRWFWGEIGGKGSENAIERDGKVQKVQMEVDMEAWKEIYEDALAKLGDEVKGT